MTTLAKKVSYFNSPSLLFALNISSGAPSFCSSFFSFPSVLDSSGIADCSTLDLSKQKNSHKYKIYFYWLTDWFIHWLNILKWVLFNILTLFNFNCILILIMILDEEKQSLKK